MEIDGKKVRTRSGATIMQAAAEAGATVPHFCYHPKLSIAANCRMCLVEVEKSPKPLPACATAALDGMVVRTNSQKAKAAQNSVMEFLLINHPLDCPICDQGGECQLQDLAVGYGVSKSRYQEEKRVVLEKNLGPLIATDMTRCIHCTRCVRFGREIGGAMELGMTGRGEHAEIMPFVEQAVHSELSGNMIDVCPVGALTSKPFRFTARPWELQKKPGLSMHDAWGSNLILQSKGAEVKRVTPAENENINECWIADRDRFSYLGLAADDRVLSPLLRPADARLFSEAPWSRALSLVAARLKKCAAEHGGKALAFFAAPHSTCEELFLLQKIARGLGCGNVDVFLRRRDSSAPPVSQFGFRIAELAKARAVLFVGAEPARDMPLLPTRLRGGRPRAMSIGATDIGTQVPLAAQEIARPSAFRAKLSELNQLLGLEKKPDARSLLDAAPPPSDAMHAMAAKLKKGEGGRHILLGGAACGAEDFGEILKTARVLAEGIGATVGVLDGGANGAGAAKTGAIPSGEGLSAAAMLRAKPRAVMLLNCEPRDFAESALAEKTLRAANFVGTITACLNGVRGIAEVALPAAIFGENEGTYVNGEGEAQTFAAAVPPPGQARPGWKILRKLGELLEIPGFDFSTLEEVRAMMLAADSWTAAEETSKADSPADKSAESGGDSESESELEATAKKAASFELAGGSPIYDSDMLTRRSAALQKTSQGKNAAHAFFHPDDIAASGLSEGGEAELTDGEGNAWKTRIFADSRLARGTILAYPPNLRPTGIRVESIPAQQTVAG